MTISAHSQTGSDYYIPLCVGNYTSFYTPENNTYGARKSVYSIKQTDVIDGEIAYLQEAYEIGDNSPNDTSIFQQFWLRKDATGNILMVAVNMENTGLASDAYIFPVPHLYIPNGYLTLGFSRSFTFGDETMYDTVLSVTATVGQYNNCIQVRETTVTDSVELIEDFYYALSNGLVKIQRLFHREQNHYFTASLTGILAYNCYVGLQDDEFVDENLITTYPNPAKDKVNIDLLDYDKYKTLSIYNVMGVRVITQSINQDKTQVDVSGLSTGVYFIQLSDGNNNKTHKLVIKR